MDMFGNFDFLNKEKMSKNYPYPKRTDAMASICKMFKQSLFCSVHKTSGFLKNTFLQSLLSYFSSYRLSKYRQTECYFERDPLMLDKRPFHARAFRNQNFMVT